MQPQCLWCDCYVGSAGALQARDENNSLQSDISMTKSTKYLTKHLVVRTDVKTDQSDRGLGTSQTKQNPMIAEQNSLKPDIRI
jgi:hypothetical protein